MYEKFPHKFSVTIRVAKQTAAYSSETLAEVECVETLVCNDSQVFSEINRIVDESTDRVTRAINTKQRHVAELKALESEGHPVLESGDTYD